MPLVSDIRHAIRLLAKTPIFSVTAILSLALGIAGSAAVFSLADALLLRPRVGITDPATLVDIGRTTEGEGFDNFMYPLFTALRDRTTLLEGVSAHRLGPDVMSLGNAESSERVFGTLVSGSYFSVVGVRPAAGRFFVPEEDLTPDTHPVVVLNHSFWMRRFGGNPEIVGQTLRLNNRPYTVVGVAEAGFTGTTFTTADFWVPMAMDAHVRASDQSLLNEHGAVWMTALGRLKPGVSPEQARAELAAIMRGYLEERGDERRDRWGIEVVRSARLPTPLSAPVIGFIAVLGSLTGLVLLIACSNVAAMLLARALERRREVATRLAIGASRARIMSQLLVEGLTLALLAGVLSLPLAIALVAVLTSLQPNIPIPLSFEPRVDPRVMLFAFTLAAMTSVVFALLPALQATRFQLAPALHGMHSTSDRRRAWLRHGLVASQVAMALLLLVAAGLFLRSLQQAATLNAGFNPENVDLIQIDPRIGGYRTDAEGLRVITALVDRFSRVPGVTAVGASRMVPLMGGGLGLGRLRAPGYVGPSGNDNIDADWDAITPGYFEALQVGLARGRAFTDNDREGAPFVAIVNETLANRVWPGQNPIGKTLLQQRGRETSAVITLEIVGVARNAKHRFIGERPINFIYVPLAQQFLSDMNFYVRRTSDGSRLIELRKAVAALDPNLPVIHAQTMKDATSIGLLPQRIAAWIAGSVGGIGLLLAALGLYGLTSFSVAQRTRELAVRMALGASHRSVLSLVIKQAIRLALIGAVIGFLLAIGATQLLNSLLIGLGPVDPLAFGAATVLLMVVLLVASWVPASRAAHMDPMRALRAE